MRALKLTVWEHPVPVPGKKCNYGSLHETYALTKIVYFVMTGRTNTTNIKNQAISTLVRKGLSVDKKERYQSVEELKNAVKLL